MLPRSPNPNMFNMCPFPQKTIKLSYQTVHDSIIQYLALIQRVAFFQLLKIIILFVQIYREFVSASAVYLLNLFATTQNVISVSVYDCTPVAVYFTELITDHATT